MTAPIDPIRRIASMRKAGRADAHVRRPADDADPQVPPGEAARSHLGDPVDEAAFQAHVNGQERRRGLRAGHDVLDTAKSAYARTEWSGAADRRLRAGRITKTKI